MRRPPQLRRLPAIAALALFAGGLLAAGSLIAAAPDRLSPRTPLAITRVLSQGPHAGDCERCHTMHAEGTVPEPHALTGPNDNSLCLGCHSTAWEGGSYGGPWLYDGSDHGASPEMVWPGPVPPARVEPGPAGKCLNCHDPHGWRDALGVIPFLGLVREEGQCLACHDGSPATSNVRNDQLKPYRHPGQDYSDRHTGPTESLPTDFGITPANRRHAECVDCHNPHVARSEATLQPRPDAASSLLLGVSRIAVFNGGAGAPPGYEFIPASDTLSSPGGDWQLCFKCHSSWTTQPSGQTDLARALNPNNPSYHPVEAAGRNPNISGLAFAPGWDATSRTRCGDCHGSDDPTTRGPHGSLYRYILNRPYTASSAPRMTTAGESCFACHAFAVYADDASPDFVLAGSRFNAPAVDKGHAGHVRGENVPCYACHETHGSTTRPHLVVTGRIPGIVSYTETSTGGSCTPTCHGTESYNLNYAR